MVLTQFHSFSPDSGAPNCYQITIVLSFANKNSVQQKFDQQNPWHLVTNSWSRCLTELTKAESDISLKLMWELCGCLTKSTSQHAEWPSFWNSVPLHREPRPHSNTAHSQTRHGSELRKTKHHSYQMGIWYQITWILVANFWCLGFCCSKSHFWLMDDRY